jgi:hypothetical protein
MKIEDPAPEFKKIFETSPGLFLVLLPDSPQFTVVAISDAYLNATLKHRNEIIGRSIFDSFSADLENPYNPLANGIENLRNSLQEVVNSRTPTRTEAQNHGMGSIVTPVLGEGGQIINVIYGPGNRVKKERDQEMSADDAIYLLDASGRILSGDAGAELSNG